MRSFRTKRAGRRVLDAPPRCHACGLVAALALCLATGPGRPVEAADTDGNFAIKGGGVQPCSALLTAHDRKSDDLGLYAGWIDGYLTGLNQFSPQTYDLATWQGSDTLLSMTRAVCQQMPPDTRVLEAFLQIVRAIQPGRLQQEEGLVALLHNGKGTAIYGSILITAKTRLNALGHQAGAEDTAFTEATALAFQRFQKAEGLAETGLPDQQTLYRLLRLP